MIEEVSGIQDQSGSIFSDLMTEMMRGPVGYLYGVVQGALMGAIMGPIGGAIGRTIWKKGVEGC